MGALSSSRYVLYTEIMVKPSPRSYRKRKRAESEEETRRRITVAAVELHGTIGPANTTVTEVAKVAGVSRMTVYNHFPTDVDLFKACSTHWATQNPFPDPSGWTAIADPSERLVGALSELYGWYGSKERMLGNVLRDVSIVPALAEVMHDLWSTFMDDAVNALAHGWSLGSVETEPLHAILRLAVDFNTWRVLTGSGLDHPVAAELVARMVSATFGPRAQ
jgi:AcrR family transcriptional regulator